jgi:large subunit ribosomal protein L15
MKLSDLRPAPGATKSRKRIGRGPGSGHGKTSTKGNKGHNARSGGGKGGGFEGGQMPLHGGRDDYAIVNLKSLGSFAANAVVDPEGLVKAGLIKNGERGRVKVLGGGEVQHALTVRVHAISESAKAKIEAKGGRVEVVE